jgi:L-cysteine desulfidase
MLKNAMAVGIPGTGGASGIDLAAALGAFGGDAGAELRVLAGIRPEVVERARSFVTAGNVHVSLGDTREVLFIEVSMTAGLVKAKARIQGDYTRVTLLERNGSALFVLKPESSDPVYTANTPIVELSVQAIHEFVEYVPLEELRPILTAASMNTTLSREGLAGSYGLGLGSNLALAVEQGIFGKGMATMAIMETTAAVDARMAGCPLPAMTNSGSGNQGITATMPVVVAARELKSSEDKLARALALSHLTSIHMRQHWDRLSAMCGTIAAGTGSACGIVYLLGGSYPEMVSAIANMAGDLSGMVCDGAKPACVLKASSAVQSAFKAAMLAMQGIRTGGTEGIVDIDVEKIIDNLGRISSEGMRQTDAMVLDMMQAKQAAT